LILDEKKRLRFTRVQQAAREVGLTMSDVARRIGVTPHSVHRWYSRSHYIPQRRVEDVVAVINQAMLETLSDAEIFCERNALARLYAEREELMRRVMEIDAELAKFNFFNQDARQD